jgi:hypothetical protein
VRAGTLEPRTPEDERPGPAGSWGSPPLLVPRRMLCPQRFPVENTRPDRAHAAMLEDGSTPYR